MARGSGTFEILIGTFEFMIAIFVIIGLVLAFVYHVRSFFEPRMSSVVTALKLYALFVMFASLLMPFAGISNWVFLSVFVTGGMWLNLLTSNFPFVNIASVRFIAPFLMCVVSHCLFTYHMILGWDCGVFLTMSYFVLFIWGIPLVAATALCALDDSVEYKARRQDLGLGDVLSKVVNWLKHLVTLGARKTK